jgi:hypothetical protein
MKKQSLFLGITLIMLLAIGTCLMATNYIVSGAGTADANGTYIEQTGLVDGKPWYQKANGYVIQSYFSGGYWNLDTDISGTTTLYCAQGWAYGNPTPPETGWMAYFGAEPPPTVTEEGPVPVTLSSFTASYVQGSEFVRK